jgi:hypothetical protein
MCGAHGSCDLSSPSPSCVCDAGSSGAARAAPSKQGSRQNSFLNADADGQ